jgi:hypothetical protein
VNQQLRMLARFDRLYTRHYRAHRRIKADKEVNAADFATCNVILFGDPGSNRWIARIRRKLPICSTRQAVMLGATTFSVGEYFPTMVYPNPFNSHRYIVLNTGLTGRSRIPG